MNARDKWGNTRSINSENKGQVWHLSDATSGAIFKPRYISQEVRRIIEPILIAITETKSANIKKEVEDIVSIITELIMEQNIRNVDLSNFPPFFATNLEDGSFLIEWIFLNYRVGFVIDPEPNQSIWYLISKDESSDVNQSGSLNSKERRAALRQLVSYVASNS